MISYVARRFVHAIPVLVGITLVAFLLIRLIPGDPVQVMLGMHATPERIAQLRAALGLDEALPSSTSASSLARSPSTSATRSR